MCILIDDDHLCHEVWKRAAARAQVKLICHYSAAGFWDHLANYDRSLPIYVDAQLGAGACGVVLARAIKEKGFDSVNLCTGSHKVKFAYCFWLDAVRGKEPPF